MHGRTCRRAGPPPLDLHHHLQSFQRTSQLQKVTFQVEVSSFHFSNCLVFRQTRSNLPEVHQEICLLLASCTKQLSSTTDRKDHSPQITSITSLVQECLQQPMGEEGSPWLCISARPLQQTECDPRTAGTFYNHCTSSSVAQMLNSLSLKIHRSNPVDAMPQQPMQQKTGFVPPSKRNCQKRKLLVLQSPLSKVRWVLCTLIQALC